jgi:hypothetical protein
MNAHPSGVAQGSLSIPLCYSFGSQFDVAGGVGNGQGFWGAAGQGFWRDPGVGLVGAVALHSDNGIAGTSKHAYVNRYGGEGSLYLGNFTPEVAVGYQNGNSKTGAFAVLDLGWYPLDNLWLSGGVDLNPGHTHALLGAEYQLGLQALPGLSVFAESAISGQRDSYALTGFRVYFGPDKMLIRRHREDDPESPIVDQGIDNGLHAANAPPPAPLPQPVAQPTNTGSGNSGGGGTGGTGGSGGAGTEGGVNYIAVAVPSTDGFVIAPP